MNKLKTFLFSAPALFKRCFMAVFLLFLLEITVNAQNVNWTSGYPKLDSQPIVVLEDNRAIQIRFTPLAANISNAVVEVQLPPNVEYVSTTTPTAGLTISASSSGTLVTGKKVSINVTSNGNQLLQNTEVELFVNINAKCNAAGASNFDIKVKSGATLVTNGQKSLTANIVVPSLALSSSDGTINYPTQATVNTITYYLKTNTANKASSAKVIFSTDLTSTLSDFKIKGVSFSPTITANSTTRFYTFEFTQTELGSKIDQTNDKVITFKGGSTQCGSHIISANVQFPHNSNCASATGSLVTMAFPTVVVPDMVHVSTNYVDALDAVIANTAINMDGVTPTNVKTVFRNDGGSNAQNIQFGAWHYGAWGYMDTNNIYVQVEGGSKRKVTASEITGTTNRSDNASYAYYKPGAKPSNITIKIADEVPPGKTITFWIPTINGDIYDNGSFNVFHDYTTNTINGFVTNIQSVKSPCGDPGITTVVSNRIPYLSAPHFRQLPASLTFKSGQIKTQTIFVAPGSTTHVPSEYYIEVPSWLTIQSIKLTSNMDGTGTVYAQTHTTHSPTLHSVRYSGLGTMGGQYLQIEYQAGACGAVNQSGQIKYWVNQNWSYVLEKISQVFQDVTLECIVNGVSLDDFKRVRTTVGLKDADNNGVPDDGTTAPSTDIRHDIYVDGDEGYFYWEGTIQAPGGYKFLDMPVKTTGFTLGTSGTNVILTGGNTVSINSVPSGTVTYTSVNANNGYFRFSYPTGIPSGANVKITVPFRVNAGTNNYNNIETEFYVSNTAVANPNNSASDIARVGKDKSSAQLGLYNMDRLNWWNKDSRNEVFTNNSVITPSLGYVDIFHSGKFSPPYFSKEVRFHEYLEKLEWNLPKGYKLISPLAFNGKTLAEDGSSTTQKKIYKVSNLYDLTFDGSGPLAPGKMQLPDDFWRLNITGGIQATRAAKIGNSTMTRVATWRKPGGGTHLETLTVTFIYSGEGVVLDVNPKTITAYGPTVKNPVLTLTNPNSFMMQDVYFYIDGNVKDVELLDVNTSLRYTGIGLNNCWVKVTNLNPGESKSFEMKYTYNGNLTCTSDPVTVYTASGFNAPWTPNTSLPLDLTDDLHVGLSDDFIIQTAPATISGAITSNKDTIPEASIGDYTIKATFHTLSSGGALKNPEMIITVPEGQVYQSGTAQIEFPIGTFTPVPAAMDAALATALGTGTGGSARNYTLKLADANGGDIIIPGNLDPIANNPADLTASIVLTMKAECNTNINGLQYQGVISGKSACNAPASGNGTQIVSTMIYPDISYNYLFDKINVATRTGIKAFNETQTHDTLLLSVKKITGSVNNMLATDHFVVKLPEELDIDGTNIHYEGSGTMSAITGTSSTVASNTVAGGVRTLRFPMPIASYNSAINKGVGANVIYKIPVNYTANGQSRAANPVDSILPTIYAEAQFGSCPPFIVAVGEGKDSIALMTADSIPYIVYLGDTAPLEITSSGFTGSWYPDKTSPTVITTSNPYLFAPTDTALLGDTTFYFSSIVDGYDYGRLPYPVKIYIHPSFTKNLDTLGIICKDTMTLSVEAFGMDLTYQWYYNMSPISGATDTFHVADKDGKYFIIATDSVGESISSDTMDVYVNVVPEFTKDLPLKITDCLSWGYTLGVETTGHHLMYQWYRNGIKIPGATNRTYYALSNDSSAYFRVSVKTVCGDSIMSKQCYLSFCDEKESEHIIRPVHLIAPGTVITNPQSGMHMVPGHSDFEFTINAKEGYGMNWLNVTTDDPIWTDQGGIVIDRISEFEAKVTVQMISRPLTVTVGGVSPLSTERIDNLSSHAWGYKGKVYIRTEKPETIYIYTVMGHLYKQMDVKEGETSFEAADGIYFVTFENGYSEKVLVRR